MKICFVAPANNYHTKKWAGWFSQRGYDVHVISFVNDNIPGAVVHYIETGSSADANDASKLRYLLHSRDIKRIIEEIRPDIVNAHYASSYGTATALSGIKHYVLSVWGSDIYDFPNKSILHKMLLMYSLRKAEYLFSTSRAMAEEASKYTKKHFDITPFGVDTVLFSPEKRTRIDHDFVVGSVKGLSYTYGIDYLIRAVAIIRKEHPEIPIHLRIAGKGPDEQAFKQLARESGIEDITAWLGFISQDEAAKEWANMDVAVIPSLSESFGVSAVEAQACNIPVIISDVPGLLETTVPGVSSVVVPKNDERALSRAIVDLYKDTEKRCKLGNAGRNYVKKKYEYHICFQKIEDLLFRSLKHHK